MIGNDYPYVWFWNPRMGEKNRKGMRCRVLIRGGRNTALVELEDGERVYVSRNVLRKAK
jgi:hypothetical protein